MICPKCKTKVSKDDTFCPKCNLKLIFKCPRCGSPSRLGSVSCKQCGYTFVKFCPKCQSANYATSSICRKCGYEFDNNTDNHPIDFSSTPEILKEPDKKQKQDNTKEEKKETKEKDKQKDTLQLCVVVDLTNIERIFEKYNKDEFKQKVIQNIQTNIKIAFGAESEFLDSRYVKFITNYQKTTKILDKINRFNEECEKFNQILERTLNCGVTYKFAILTPDEAKKNIKNAPQLKFGYDKDVIVSSGAYLVLSSELSLIRVSQESYKMIFLDQKPVFEYAQDVKYEKALETILENLSDNNSDIRAISVNAPRGGGKTHLLENLFNRINKVKSDNTLVFFANCSPLTQITSYGLIQNFFRELLDCPTILSEDFNLKKFEKRVLDKLNLEKIEEESLQTLANLIYPLKKDYFENILINKEITYKYLKDIFNYLKKKKNLIFIVDDFDLVDESSFGFLKHLVNENYFENNAKLILGYKNNHSIAIYFQSSKLSNNACLNISLRALSGTETKNYIHKVLGDNCKVPPEIMTKIAYNAQGNIAYIEQLLQYLFEKKILVIKDKTVIFQNEFIDFEMPSNIEDCLKERLEFLKEKKQGEYDFLMCASLMGDKLDYSILTKVFEMNEDEYNTTVSNLEKKGYLKPKLNGMLGFKNSLTWSYCYIQAKEELEIKKYAKKLLNEITQRIVTTPLICSILAQIAQDYDFAYNLWSENLQFASYIGDLNIYAMAQKQCLILLEKVKINNFEEIKNNICERLGKLIYIKNPKEARDYLTNALLIAQKNDNINKVIDISGYLTKSLYLIQDFGGVVEIVDNVLKYFESSDKFDKKPYSELQSALIKTRKLEAMLILGKWEEISNVVNTQITPVLQKHLHIFAKQKWISQSEIFYSWIESKIILAQTYCEQGSPLAFDLIDEINKVLSREKGQKIDTLKVRLAFARAIANTSKGYFEESDLILQEILKDYSYAINSSSSINKWNIINIINKILKKELSSIKEELFEAAQYADNANDEYAKNLLKTLLAYVYLEDKSYIKALEISGNQMQYFSEKKIALGALLAWYISAASTAYTKPDTYCIEICEKAVKICENAQNNNFYFKIMFQELLVNIYLKLNDLENASMYCDLALQSAAANELLYHQVRLNYLRAKIAREKLSTKPDTKKQEHALNVIKLYNRAIDMARILKLEQYIKIIEKDLTSFRAHCQLNRIIEG